MFITIEQKVECSKCGSSNYERFSDSHEQGLRCKDCGHEKREPLPHLTTTEGGTSWASTRDTVTKF